MLLDDQKLFLLKVKGIAVLFISLISLGCAFNIYEILLVGFCHPVIRAAQQWEVYTASAVNFSQWSPETLQDLTVAAILRSPEEVFFSVYISETIQQSVPPKGFGR